MPPHLLFVCWAPLFLEGFHLFHSPSHLDPHLRPYPSNITFLHHSISTATATWPLQDSHQHLQFNCRSSRPLVLLSFQSWLQFWQELLSTLLFSFLSISFTVITCFFALLVVLEKQAQY